MTAVVLVPIAFFACISAVILGALWLSHRGRLAALRVIGEAVGKGQTLDLATIDRLLLRRNPPVGKWYAILCFLVGVAGAGTGLALAASSTFLGDGLGLDAVSRAGMMVGACVNGSIGFAFLVLGAASLSYLSGRNRPAPNWDYGSVLALICLFFGAGGLSLGAGLALGSLAYGAADPTSAASAGMLVGALMNGCTGGGLAALGVFILRTFGYESIEDKAET